MSATRHIVAIVTEQGVNMGDHAADLTHAVVIDPDETIGSLAERVLTVLAYVDGAVERQYVPSADKYLTLRLAVDA